MGGGGKSREGVGFQRRFHETFLMFRLIIRPLRFSFPERRGFNQVDHSSLIYFPRKARFLISVRLWKSSFHATCTAMLIWPSALYRKPTTRHGRPMSSLCVRFVLMSHVPRRRCQTMFVSALRCHSRLLQNKVSSRRSISSLGSSTNWRGLCRCFNYPLSHYCGRYCSDVIPSRRYYIANN